MPLAIMHRFLSHFSKPELVLTLCAFVLRLLLVSFATWYPVSDTRDYHELAFSLTHGQGYQQLYNGETEVFKGFTFYAFREPGYPVFLAILYSLLGWNPFWAYVSNAVCDTITLIGVLLLAKRLLNPRVALIAGSVWAANVVWTPSLMTESLFTALFTLLLWLGVTEFYFRSRRHALTFGLLLTLAFFVRPIAAALLPLAAYSCWRMVRVDSRTAMTTFACILIPLLIASAAWTVRNYAVLAAFVPLTTNLGAHNADSFGVDWQNAFRELRQQGLNEAQINSYLVRQIEAAVIAQPISAAKVFVERPFDLLSLTPAWEMTYILRRLTFGGEGGSSVVQWLYVNAYDIYYAAYPLSAFGMLFALLRRLPIGSLLLTLFSFTLLQSIVSPGNVRFAAPFYPILCLFAAYAVATILQFAVTSATHARNRKRP